MMILHVLVQKKCFKWLGRGYSSWMSQQKNYDVVGEWWVH